MSRHRQQDDEETTAELTPILTDANRPLVAHRLQAKVRLVVVLAVVAVVCCSGAAAYIGSTYAYRRSAAHTDARVRALEQDRDRRSQQRDAEAESLRKRIDRDAATARRDVCAAIAHQPNDKGPVQQLRQRYRCPYKPLPAGKPSAAGGSGGTSGPSAAGSSASGRSRASGGSTGSSSSGSSGGGSGSSDGGSGSSGGGSSPTPPPSGGGGDQCLLRLPLLGCIL